MKDNPLMKYSEQLAVDIDLLCRNMKNNSNICFQIKKSSSSAFANISEGQYAQSPADMLSKFKIARKECIETESWLKLLLSNKSIGEDTYKKHRNLCGRIRRLLTASCIALENRMNSK